MASAKEVTELATSLSERKIINLNTTLEELLNVPGLDLVNPGEKAGWYALGGDHFVVVCGSQPGSFQESAQRIG